MATATLRLPPLHGPARPAGSGRAPGAGHPLLLRLAAAAAAWAVLATAGPAAAQEPDAGERPPLPADSAAVELEPLHVRVDPPPRRGKMAGFHRRSERGMGRFITRREIERRDPVRLSDLVRLGPGTGTVPHADGSGRRHVEISRAAFLEDTGVCRVRYWIDGVPLHGASRFELDELSPRDVEGIEIYRGASEIPPRFNRRGSQCGVIVVWTREPSAR